jgi:RimJ/RimL family protein N-acetyltransferase
MKLYPVQESDSATVARWLAEDSNLRWLDFGGTAMTPLTIQVMAHKPTHCLRLFSAEDTADSIGIVALSEIHPSFKTAQLWYVLGDKAYAGRGYASRAVALILQMAFGELRLRSINAWTVETNTPSISVLRANGFRQAGRLRGAHEIDGCIYDRLLFDLLPSDFAGTHERYAEYSQARDGSRHRRSSGSRSH